MILKVQKSCLDGEIEAIPSKSFVHRMEIANFLSGEKPLNIKEEHLSEDIKATRNCIENLKARKKILDCGESGTTLRLFIPLCAVLGGEHEFTGHGKLMARPNDELLKVLNNHHIKTEKTENSIKISGNITSGDFLIRGDISSQYITGLLMALPLLKTNSNIILSTPLMSAPYVDMTIEVLKNYNIYIEKKEYGFFIPGDQKYKKINPSYKVEGDWSNSAIFLVMGATNGRVTIDGLNTKSLQGDRRIYDLLKKLNVNITEENGKITVKKSPIGKFIFDAKNTPDLVPSLAVLASFSDGECVIKNIERLRLKESDRVQSIMAMLKSFNIRTECYGNDLAIFGGEVKGEKVDSFNDHRIVMASSALAFSSDEPVSITNAQAINKSYPSFFDALKKIGGILYEY